MHLHPEAENCRLQHVLGKKLRGGGVTRKEARVFFKKNPSLGILCSRGPKLPLQRLFPESVGWWCCPLLFGGIYASGTGKDSCSIVFCAPLPPLQNSVLSTSTNRSRNSPMLEHTSLGQNSIQNGKDRYGVTRGPESSDATLCQALGARLRHQPIEYNTLNFWVAERR